MTAPAPWLTASLRVGAVDDIEAFEKTPLSDWRLPRSVFEAIAARAALQPEAPAIHCIPDGDRPEVFGTWSYAELLAAIARTANLLRSLGVQEGDGVALLLPNVPAAHACLWAAETAGVAVPINHMLEPVQIASIVEEAGCKVVVALGARPDFDIWEKVGALECASVRCVVRVDATSLHTNHVIPATRDPSQPVDTPAWIPGQARDDVVHTAGLAGVAEIIDWHSAQSRCNPTLDFAPTRDPTNPAAQFHTGGTTGRPKLAWQSHANQVVNCWTQYVALDIAPGHVRLCGLPLFHVNGALANGLALFMAGATLVLTGARGYRDGGILRHFWQLVERFRANSFAAVPTFLVALMQVDPDGADLSSLQFVRCGTAPLSTQLAREFGERTGVDLIEGYGMTEATSISAMNPRFGPKRIGSVGLRIPYQRVEIRTPAGEPCAAGERGHVFVQGPNVIPGYRDANETSASFAADGWFDTGDLGWLDDDGYLWLTGRAKDIIIRGGHNLDPRMVEEVLYAHPAVEHAAAIGRPDRYTGEMPVAFVSLKPGARVDPETLLQFATARIPERAAVPKEVQVLRRMPLTAVGKIHKPALRELAADDGYREALGGMLGAYNLRMQVAQEGGAPLIRLECRDLSPTLHADVRRFVEDALRTFTLRYRLDFTDSFAATERTP